VVLVMLGSDLAGKPLPLIASAATTTPTSLASVDISTSTSGG
jgi:hypothetical protein